MASNPLKVDLERRPYAAALLEVAMTAAKEAGKVIETAFYSEGQDFETKSGSADLVTETDKKCEELIASIIHENFSGHQIIGEESSEDNKDLRGVLTDEPTWIIDPVDGTNNFVHKLPMVTVSIGVYVAKKPVAAVVYNPLSKEMFTAIVKGGAYLNGTRIHVSDVTTLSNAAIASEAGYDRSEDGVELQMARLQKVLRVGQVQSFRMHGCCTFNLTALACGRLDGYYEGRDVQQGPKPWDWAAGALIVQEAGGVMCSMEGGELDIFSGRGIAACSSTVADELVQLLSSVTEP
jgi:fructose-1,6-bisphosphatase/inositol monophosphatase family enzyme